MSDITAKIIKILPFLTLAGLTIFASFKKYSLQSPFEIQFMLAIILLSISGAAFIYRFHWGLVCSILILFAGTCNLLHFFFSITNTWIAISGVKLYLGDIRILSLLALLIAFNFRWFKTQMKWIYHKIPEL